MNLRNVELINEVKLYLFSTTKITTVGNSKLGNISTSSPSQYLFYKSVKKELGAVIYLVPSIGCRNINLWCYFLGSVWTKGKNSERSGLFFWGTYTCRGFFPGFTLFPQHSGKNVTCLSILFISLLNFDACDRTRTRQHTRH